MAVALDAVGERWALLIVRELMLSTRSFTQLSEALAGIGTDILTARLRSLETAGVIRRSGQGQRRGYTLTDDGRALQGVITELARWGADKLSPPKSPDQLQTRAALTALLLDAPPIPSGLDGTYAIESGNDTALISVSGTDLTLDPADGAEMQPIVAKVYLTSPTGIFAFLTGTEPDELLKLNELTIDGDKRKATALLDALAESELLTPYAHAAAPASHTVVRGHAVTAVSVLHSRLTEP